MIFEWDPRKAASNLRRHEVSFDEAASVFRDPLAWTFPDPDDATSEHREITVGFSSRGRVLVVIHCERGGRLRIISARRATPRERREYAQFEVEG